MNEISCFNCIKAV